MAVLKIEALRYLRDRIVCLVPDLEGKVCVGQAPPNHGLGFPSMAIIPVGKWKWHADQEDDQVASPAPDRVVVRVGYHEVRIQLQLAATTPEERYQLEQDVEQAFMATEMHPGIIFGDVRACEDDFGVFEASFMLDSEDWVDSKALAGQSWSYIDVIGSIPALATRRQAYTLTELRLGLAEFGPEITTTNFGTSADVERVSVADDGSITPA